MAELFAQQAPMLKRLEEAWDELTYRHEGPPLWLRRLALQLELWVGEEELSKAVYYEASFDYPPEDLREAQPDLKVNAYNSEALYLRALTSGLMVVVDVKKASGQHHAPDVSVRLIPRNRLTALEIEEVRRDGRSDPETFTLKATYGTSEVVELPRNREELHWSWQTTHDLPTLRELQGDLWKPVTNQDAEAVIKI